MRFFIISLKNGVRTIALILVNTYIITTYLLYLSLQTESQSRFTVLGLYLPLVLKVAEKC